MFPLPPIELIGDAWAEQEKLQPSLAQSLMAKLPSWLGGSAGETAGNRTCSTAGGVGRRAAATVVLTRGVAWRVALRVRGCTGVSPHKHEERQKEDYGNHHMSSAYGDSGTVVVWREGGVSVDVVSVADHKAYVRVCSTRAFNTLTHARAWCWRRADGRSTCLQGWASRSSQWLPQPRGSSTT